MAEISNKFLLVLAVIALIIPLTGTILCLQKLQALGITGKAPSPITSGTAQLNVIGQAIVNVSQPSIDWGNVAVPQGNESCYVDSEGGSNNCATCTGTPCSTPDSGFVYHNIGSVNINVTVAAGKTAAQFLGGTLGGGPVYSWKSRNKTQLGGYAINIISTYTGTSTSATLAYYNMTPTNSTHTFDAYLDLNLTIPRDAGTGAKTDTITFTAVET